MNSLRVLLAAVVGLTVVQALGGFVSGSLALLAGTGYGLTVAVSLGLALAAAPSAARTATVQRTFGFQRAEILASLANALVLWVFAGWILLEAYQRLTAGPEVQAYLVTAAAGLLVHFSVFRVLGKPAREHISFARARGHAACGMGASGAALAAGAWAQLGGGNLADVVLGALIGILALVTTWHLLSHVVHVLLEGTPEHIDIYRLCSRIEELPGVTLIHDVHVWTLAPDYDALTAHVMVEPEHRGQSQALLDRIRSIAYEEFNIHHITVQIETTAANCREDHHVDHLVATAAPAQ